MKTGHELVPYEGDTMAFVVQICTFFTAGAHLWREIKSLHQDS